VKLRDLGEFGLIERIAARASRNAGVKIGIGDDAAAIEPTAGLATLITTDMLLEGVHFDLSFSDPLTLGRKSLAVNLSDIAAMGGIPRYFLLSLAAPRHMSVDFLDRFINGVLEMGKRFGVSLVGGDTCSSQQGMIISVTVIGEQYPDLVVSRSGARPGDLVCVTGTVGDSALGLSLLQTGLRDGAAISRHLDPTPRVREGMMLAEAKLPSAMTDISDGLLADLGHILDLSGVGARLFLDKLPLSADYLERYSAASQDIYSLPLSGGEDYELLFTTSPGNIATVQALLKESGTGCAVIGEIDAAAGLFMLTASGREYTRAERGYDHFS
jgi:thiamine-monophosphate kinase